MPLCCPTRPPLTVRERQEGLNPRPGFDLTPLHQREDVPALTLSAELLQGSQASVWSGISCTVVSLLWTSLGGARGCELKEHSSEVCRFFFFFEPLFTRGEFAGAWVNWSGTLSFTPTQSPGLEQTLPSRADGRTRERRWRLFFPFYVLFLSPQTGAATFQFHAGCCCAA